MVPVRRAARDWRAYLARGGLVLKDRWKQITISVFSFGLFIGIIGQSKEFQECIERQKSHAAYHHLHDGSGSVVKAVVRFQLNVACTLADGDALVALFTLMLTVSTTLLWIETLRLRRGADAQQAADRIAREADAAHLTQSLNIAKASADAAKVSAEASLGVELPRLELQQVSKNNPSVWDAIRFGGVSLIFKNYGRTTAHLIEYGVEGVVCDFLPDAFQISPNKVRRYEIGAVCVPDGTARLDFGDLVTLTTNEISHVQSGREKFQVYGFIAYRDFLGGHWITKFCLYLHPPEGGTAFLPDTITSNYNGHERYDHAKRPHVEDALEYFRALQASRTET